HRDRDRDGPGLDDRRADRRVLSPPGRRRRRGPHRARDLRARIGRPPAPHGRTRGGSLMTRRRLAVTAALLLAAAALAPRAAADAPDCPRWREAFAQMPLKMLSLETGGGKTLALRVRAADTPERQAGGFQCATPTEIQRNLILFDFG